MKWKTVLVTTVIVLLITALCLMGSKVLKKDIEPSIKERIKQYKLIAEEQRFITEIWTLRYEAALMQAKFNPVPDANTP